MTNPTETPKLGGRDRPEGKRATVLTVALTPEVIKEAGRILEVSFEADPLVARQTVLWLFDYLALAQTSSPLLQEPAP